MQDTFRHTENKSLLEIINNINNGDYDILEIDNIRITSKNKSGFVILCSDVNVGNNIYEYLKLQKVNNQTTFENIFLDFYVVSDIDESTNQSFTMSLTELIFTDLISSTKEWDINEPVWNVDEINYDYDSLSENSLTSLLKDSDLK